MLTAVIISDSNCDQPGFRYGLACVLREAGIFVLWTVCRSGAKAKELEEAWEKAPQCDIGLTVYNANDVTKEWLWPESLSADISGMVVAARQKCARKQADVSVVFYSKARSDNQHS